jgi:hypothetical protein
MTCSSRLLPGRQGESKVVSPVEHERVEHVENSERYIHSEGEQKTYAKVPCDEGEAG